MHGAVTIIIPTNCTKISIRPYVDTTESIREGVDVALRVVVGGAEPRFAGPLRYGGAPHHTHEQQTERAVETRHAVRPSGLNQRLRGSVELTLIVGYSPNAFHHPRCHVQLDPRTRATTRQRHIWAQDATFFWLYIFHHFSITIIAHPFKDADYVR